MFVRQRPYASTASRGRHRRDTHSHASTASRSRRRRDTQALAGKLAGESAEESLERDAQRRREEAMQRRRAEKPDLLAAQLAIRQSHRNRRIGESEWVSTAAAVSVDSPVRRHFRGRRGGHGAGGHHDTGWGRRSPTNRASQSSSSSGRSGPPIKIKTRFLRPSGSIFFIKASRNPLLSTSRRLSR